MSGHKAKAEDKLAVGIAGGTDSAVAVAAPSFTADFECIGADGIPKWKTRWQNVVTDEGKGMILNRCFGATTTQSTPVWYLGLHSLAATNATHRLSNITASEIGGYAANRALIGGFASTYVSGSGSATATYGFTAAGPYTVSGAFVCNVLQTATTAGILYSEGNFGASRQVVSNDTLNVTVTLSYN